MTGFDIDLRDKIIGTNAHIVVEKEIGIKNSSAQITKNYSKDELKGKLILAVVNFPPRKVGPFVSEVLTLGVPDKNNETILVEPEKEVEVGGKLN